jgi:NAD(P)-dependent dehydrogenase (short-subunit alcohol dehydrogenase family)
MKKQTIVITGASSGVGKAIARLFLDNGDNVVLNSLTMDKLMQVSYELGGSENMAIVAGNVSDRITGIKLLATALARFGSVDVLVNNAGIFETKPFFHVDEGYLDRFLDVNLKGTFLTTQGIIPQMLKQRDGIVINIGMPFISAMRGAARNTTALAHKGPVHALTLQLAAEFGSYNISFNTVTPGLNTEPTGAAMEKFTAGMHLYDRTGEAQDLAKMVYAIAKKNL